MTQSKATIVNQYAITIEKVCQTTILKCYIFVQQKDITFVSPHDCALAPVNICE